MFSTCILQIVVAVGFLFRNGVECFTSTAKRRWWGGPGRRKLQQNSPATTTKTTGGAEQLSYFSRIGSSVVDDEDNRLLTYGISQELKGRLAKSDTSTVTIDGYVVSKRKLGNSLFFVDFCAHDRDLELFQVLIRRELFVGDHYDGYRKCLFTGCRMSLAGVASPTRNPGEAVLLVTSVRLVAVPRQPQHVRSILTLALQSELPLEEVAGACSSDVETFRKMLGDITRKNGGGKTSLDGKKVRAFTANLPPYPPKVARFFDALNLERSSRETYRLPDVPAEWTDPPPAAVPITSGAVAAVTERDRVLSVGEAVAVARDGGGKFTTCRMAGWVRNRRRYSRGVTGVNMVDDPIPPSKNSEDDAYEADYDRVECIIHPRMFDRAEKFGNLLAVGSIVGVEGNIVCNPSDGKISFWVSDALLMKSSWRPTVVQYVVELLHTGDIDVEEGAQALGISYFEAEKLSRIDDLTRRQWECSKLSVALQTSKSANMAPELLQVLDKYKDLSASWPILSNHEDGRESQAPAPNETILQSSLPGSYWQRKKRPQLEWMGREIANVARAHPEFGKRRLHILDIGGGKGRLANYLAQYLGNSTKVHVIDIAENAIANGAMRAKRLKVDVNFQVGDASAKFWDEHAVDIVVALHACGHLSDVALANAVHHRAGFVICPCCFSSNPRLLIPGTAPGGGRVEDYLGIPSADWSALKLVAEVQGDTALASSAIHAICSVRAAAVSSKMPTAAVRIKSFPIQYSTRNICLIAEAPSPQPQ